MLRLVFLLISVFCVTRMATCQIVDIPDIKFLNALIDFDVDKNGDGQIQQIEADSITNLVLTNKDISSMVGIKAFRNLDRLVVRENPLDTLDVSGLDKIVRLYCEENELKHLNIAGMTNLSWLECCENKLEFLNLDGLDNLFYLLANGNMLKTMHIDGLARLRKLGLGRNEMTNLSVTNCPKLDYFTCESNHIIDLVIENLPAMEIFSCYENPLTELDLSAFTRLERLFCGETNIESLNVKNGSALTIDDVFFDDNPNLRFICVDDEEQHVFESRLEEYEVTNVVVNSYCSFIPGGLFYDIVGASYFDADENGCDSLDISVQNQNYSIYGELSGGGFKGDHDGFYRVAVGEGRHVIKLHLEHPEYFSVDPDSVIIVFPSDTSPFVQNFCLERKADFDDLEILLVPLDVPQAGFTVDYKLIYRNVGTSILSGKVELLYESDKMELIESTPPNDGQQTNLLTWDFVDLTPFESRKVELRIKLNGPMDSPPLTNGSLISFQSQVDPLSTDVTPENNLFSLSQSVVNSFDPNDKICLQGDVIKPEMVGDYVHYMIRFENKGSANAVNIVVKDVIDVNRFDITSLVTLDGSHPFSTRVRDENIVEFIFEQINLPFEDESNDGYMVFKIKSIPTLVVGDILSNEAEIYFDFNFPIVTEKVKTIVSDVSSTLDHKLWSETVRVFPNPAQDMLIFESEVDIEQVEIFDVSGRLMSRLIPLNYQTNMRIPTHQLKSGVYFINIRTTEGWQTRKIMVKNLN